METIKLNIAIKLPKDVADKAISLSSEINSRYNSLIKLDETGFIPHITLYQTEFPLEELQNIEEELLSLVSGEKQFEVKVAGIGTFYDGVVYLNFDVDERLKSLHERIVSQISPLRKGLVREKYSDPAFTKDLSDYQKEIALEHSSPWILNSYSPHITLAQLTNASEGKDVESKYRVPFGSFTAEEIGLYESDDGGVCKRLIASFPVKI